ncbi:response regulator [Streptomyces sp. NPDC091272]|uniref:response regulator n=1 Tax=Streptomyces sp. NPDC091272 TaxID=3365981 RepID=UPI0037FA4C18
MIEVLVVDDDPRVAGINAAYTERVPGFRAAGTAHTTGEALAWLDEHHADLVLLDHYLPDENGLRLLRRLRESGSRTDVIMVTADRDVATVEAAMRYGALHYLVKPFSYSGLRAKLEGYAVLRRTLADGPEAGQDQVDRIFGVLGSAAAGPTVLPKGHSAQTVRLVRQVLRETGQLSASGTADRTGLSRQTAQRYLKLLEKAGQVGLTLRYTGSGRPEHVYTWTGTDTDE